VIQGAFQSFPENIIDTWYFCPCLGLGQFMIGGDLCLAKVWMENVTPQVLFILNPGERINFPRPSKANK